MKANGVKRTTLTNQPKRKRERHQPKKAKGYKIVFLQGVSFYDFVKSVQFGVEINKTLTSHYPGNIKKTAKFSNSSSALATKSEKPPQFLDTGSARAQASSIRQQQWPKKSPLDMTFKGLPQSQDLHVQNSDLQLSG